MTYYMSSGKLNSTLSLSLALDSNCSLPSYSCVECCIHVWCSLTAWESDRQLSRGLGYVAKSNIALFIG